MESHEASLLRSEQHANVITGDTTMLTSKDFELPAPVCVCALLVAGALAKGDHPQWAIGATIFLYVLHSAAQWINRGTSSAHVVDSIMMKMRASAIGLTSAATIATRSSTAIPSTCCGWMARHPECLNTLGIF